MNPLANNPQARQVLYLAQWIVNGILGIVSIVLVAIHHNPLWWIIVQAIFNFVWTYTGVAAQTNVTGTDIEGYKVPPDPPAPEPS